MRTSTIVVLVLGTAVVAVGGYVAVSVLGKGEGLPGANPGSTGSSSNTGGSGNWADQLIGFMGALDDLGVGAYSRDVKP